jgi:hypothetical protein
VPTASYGTSLSVGGVAIQKTVNRVGDHPNSYEVPLPAGKAGSLTTRTDDNTGVVTLPAGHSLGNGVYDVYWSGGMRYGMTGTISGNELTLDGGDGDALPAEDSAVVVTEQVPINTNIDGDNIQIIGISLEFPDQASADVGHVDMQDAGATTIEEIDLKANQPVVYDIAGGAANVFTGNPITATKASNGSTTSEATLKIVSLEDSTP